MNESQVTVALAALAQTQRLRAFRALVVAGKDGLTPSTLAEQLAVAPSNLSFHLKELAHSGLVDVEPRGRNLIYRTNFAAMNALMGYLTEQCCKGASCEVTDTQPINVLFLCTHNSARSILAEALLNAMTDGRFKAYSAGSSPRENQKPNPLGLQVLQAAGISTEGLYSKSWDEFALPDAPHMDLIITVCDNAAGEVCPFWPGHPATAHWGYPDPSEGDAPEVEKREAFRKTMHAIKHRLELLCSLPKAKLEASMLQTSARQLANT